MKRAVFATRSRRDLLRLAAVAGVAATACSAAGSTAELPDLAALRRADPRSGLVRLTEQGRAGLFQWRTGDYRAAVARDPLAGRFVVSASTSPATGVWVRQGNLLTPEMFGADPAQQDHSRALHALFDQIGPNVRIELAGRYHLTRGITVARASGFSIGGTGSIVTRAGTPVAYDYGILTFVECTDFQIAGLTCDANRAARAPREVPAHTIIFQSCQRFRCAGVRSVNAVCDGFLLFSATPDRIDTHCRDFQFIDCVADNCFRQGCSVIHGHGGIFRGGSFTNSNGTAPAAGIDLECDAGAPSASISDIAFEGVRFANNRGFGLLVSNISRPQNIVADDCAFDDNELGAISWGATRGRIARASISGFGTGAQRGAIDVPVGDGWLGGEGTTIDQPRFTRITTGRDDRPLVYVHAAAYGPVAVTGLKADACSAIIGLGRDASSLTGSTVNASLSRADGAISISGKGCRIAENHVERFFGSVIVTTGADTVVRANVLSAPRHNDRNGVIRVLGAGASIEDNVIEGQTAALAIRLEAVPRVVRGNRISGFADKLVRQPG